MGKTIIAPIIAVLALAVQAIFGVEIPEEILNEAVVVIVNAVLLVTAVVGIFNDYKKKKGTKIERHVK